jgi:hypothetical protein
VQVPYAVAFFEPADATICPELPSRPAWHAQAACRGHVELFFVEQHEGHYRAAAKLCRNFPVREQCDVEGEQLPRTMSDHGYRAGLSPQARVRRRRAARRHCTGTAQTVSDERGSTLTTYDETSW